MKPTSRLRQLFRRVTSSGGYVAEIDGLRFAAITPVVAYHLWGYWGRIEQRAYPDPGPLDYALTFLLSLGHYGVSLFFTISGFVLATPFAKHVFEGSRAIQPKQYFWRRITRLEPPYVISMLLFFFAAPLYTDSSLGELLPHLLASLGYVHELIYNTGSPINNNTWSLEIEVQFYLLMPLLARLLWLPSRLRRSLFVLMILASSTHQLWLPSSTPRSIIQYGRFFLTGVLLSDLLTTHWRGNSRTTAADLPGIFACPSFLLVNATGCAFFIDIVAPWAIAALVYSALRGRWHSTILSYGAIPLIGGMCYSIYLLHARTIALTVLAVGNVVPDTHVFSVDFITAFTLTSPSVLVVSGCFFLAVEKPCMSPKWPQAVANWLSSLRRLPSVPRAGL